MGKRGRHTSRTAEPIPLGPIDLVEPIGAGGMGRVWLGVHRDQQLPVAVKVLSEKVALDQRMLDAFRNEIRAVAGLQHPGIVWVFDHGTIGEDSSRSSRGRLVSGSPFLVMEHVGGGTLSDTDVMMRWPQLLDTLRSLLRALAHAHARGVVHRDLKPSNVLRPAPGDLRPGLKLTDFGIAHALDDTTVESSMARKVMGTLNYMAPEQIRADWRAYGPWTDLYGLGCIVHLLAAGRPPFKGKKGTQLLLAQLQLPAPPLAPVLPVPQGFSDWVAMLLQKSPRDRFADAPDALAALDGLGAPVGRDVPAVLALDDDARADLPTVIVDGGPPPAGVSTAVVRRDQLSEPPPKLGRPVAWRAPQVPQDWRALGSYRPPPQLMGAGLGLFGLRALQVVGRERERDELWSALQRTARGTAQVAILQGGAGVGKSCLAQWLCETAAESGAATVVRLRVDAHLGSEDALHRLVRKYFGLSSSAEDVDKRVEGVLRATGDHEPTLVRGVVRILGGRAERPEARYAVVRRLLEIMARRKPVLVWADDVHSGSDGIGLVEHVLQAQAVRPSRVLFALTVRHDALAGDADLAARLERLAAAGRRVDVGPLDRSTHARLVRELLRLERSLALRVAERTAGNPLFAVQLVGDWVERGLLVPGPSGFELQGEEADLPASMDQVWRARLHQVLDDLGPEAVALLERAATMGAVVGLDDWGQVCDDPDGRFADAGRVMFRPGRARLRGAIMRRLLEARLAEETDEGFAFAHEMLRGTLEQMARDSGRWTQHHEACAAMLARRAQQADTERLGYHLVQADRAEEAFPYLLESVVRRQHTTGPASALAALSEAEGALRAARITEADRRWGEVFVRRATLFVELEQFSDAVRWARKAVRLARRLSWMDIEARALLSLGQEAVYNRDPDRAEPLLSRAEQLLGADGDPFLVGSAHYSLSMCARFRRDPEGVRRHAALAEQHLMRALPTQSVAGSWRLLSQCAFLDDDLPRAAELAARARVLYDERGDALGVADCLNLMGESARLLGELDRAEDVLREAASVCEEAGSQMVLYPLLNLALVSVARGDWTEAMARARRALQLVVFQRRVPMEIGTHAVISAAAAGAGDWDAFDESALRVAELLQDCDVLERDLGACLSQAGELALQRGERARARSVWRIALQQHRGLGNQDEVERLERAVSAMATAVRRRPRAGQEDET